MVSLLVEGHQQEDGCQVLRAFAGPVEVVGIFRVNAPVLGKSNQMILLERKGEPMK